MVGNQTHREILLIAVVVSLGFILTAIGAVAITAAAEDLEETETYHVDADHELDNSSALSTYEETGVVRGDVEGIDASIAISKDKATIGASGIRPLDEAHDFIGIDYREDIDRTLRIWIPSEYVTPYTRDGVASISSDHVASYQPVRDGEYLQLVVRVEGQSTARFPTHWHSEVTYGVISSYEERIAKATGGDREWRYLEPSSLEREHPAKLEVENPDDVVIQYDATPEAPEETWVNAPRGDGETVFWYAPDSENGTVYVVARTDEAPDVRVMHGGGYREKAEGWINDARLIPERISEAVKDPLESLF